MNCWLFSLYCFLIIGICENRRSIVALEWGQKRIQSWTNLLTIIPGKQRSTSTVSSPDWPTCLAHCRKPSGLLYFEVIYVTHQMRHSSSNSCNSLTLSSNSEIYRLNGPSDTNFRLKYLQMIQNIFSKRKSFKNLDNLLNIKVQNF